MTKYKGYKVRLFPTEEQEKLMWNHIGSKRFIWNYMIDLQQNNYKNNEKHLSGYDMAKHVTELKKQDEYKWLNEVSSHTLKIVCFDLHEKYKMFFNKKSNYPKFKSKKCDKKSFPIRDDLNATYFINRNVIQVPKIGKMKCKINYKNIDLTQKLRNPRISYNKPSGKWILSFSLEVGENQVCKPKLNDVSMGIDLGIKELAVVAFGNEQLVFHNINKSKRMRTLERKKKHLKRAVDRKYRTNGSYDKTKAILKYEQMIREVEYKQANIRRNYIQQITRQLVDMLPAKVVMEDLNVSGMMKNRHLSKSIWKQCWSTFREIMQYKCDLANIEFVLADRYFPSSKVCSGCGHKKKDLKLKDRTYICQVCGLAINRDYNAAINLMNYK